MWSVFACPKILCIFLLDYCPESSQKICTPSEYFNFDDQTVAESNEITFPPSLVSCINDDNADAEHRAFGRSLSITMDVHFCTNMPGVTKVHDLQISFNLEIIGVTGHLNWVIPKVVIFNWSDLKSDRNERIFPANQSHSIWHRVVRSHKLKIKENGTSYLMICTT